MPDTKLDYYVYTAVLYIPVQWGTQARLWFSEYCSGGYRLPFSSSGIYIYKPLLKLLNYFCALLGALGSVNSLKEYLSFHQ